MRARPRCRQRTSPVQAMPRCAAFDDACLPLSSLQSLSIERTRDAYHDTVSVMPLGLYYGPSSLSALGANPATAQCSSPAILNSSRVRELSCLLRAPALVIAI